MHILKNIQTGEKLTLIRPCDTTSNSLKKSTGLERHDVPTVIAPIKSYTEGLFSNFCFLSTDQRLAESVRPYLEELQDLWPWLLLTFACGGVASVAAAAAILTAKRRCGSWSLPHLNKWKMSLPERLPLLWASDREASGPSNYQTTI